MALCGALLHGPKLLFLDEPFEGIDPVTSRTIKDLLLGLQRKEVTLVMSSHVLDVVEKLCPLIAILDRGQLRRFGTLAELRSQLGTTGSLEDLFVGLMGGARNGEIPWI